jgi:hypothetical protein
MAVDAVTAGTGFVDKVQLTCSGAYIPHVGFSNSCNINLKMFD